MDKEKVYAYRRSSTVASTAPSVTREEVNSIFLNPQRQEAVLAKINVTVDYVLDTMVGGRPLDVQWRPKTTKKGIAYFVDDNVPAGQYRFCCVGQAPVPTEEVMKLFQISDTAALQRHGRILYDNVLDMRVLCVLEEPTELNPFKSTYIRYTSLASPKPLDDRDMCLVVATDMFTHEDGSTVGYCLWDSVELPECPDYSRSQGLIRSRMFRSGYFCRTPPNGTATEIVYFVGVQAGGVAPRFATRLLMERFGANLKRLCNHFRRKKLDSATFCPRDEWLSRRDVPHCRSCTKRFNSFSKRRHCACCGDVFCSSCSSDEEVDVPGAGITTLKMCRPCLAKRGLEPLKGVPPCPMTLGLLPRAQSRPRHYNSIENPFFRLKSTNYSDEPPLSPLASPTPMLARTIVLPTR